MGKIIDIGIAENSNVKIEKKNSIEVIEGKGIVGDRYFHDFNGDKEQITLIEKENIDYSINNTEKYHRIIAWTSFMSIQRDKRNHSCKQNQ